ncbi:response regulator transcription factor [Variovorax sp. LARHSF232]
MCSTNGSDPENTVNTVEIGEIGAHAPRRSVSSEVRSTLTAREQAVVQHVTKGETYKQIARALGISPYTVREYVQHAARKLGCRNRVEVATWWATRRHIFPTSVGCTKRP